MKALRHYLRFLVIVLLASAAPAIAQFREVGTGAPGPVKAPHITAELISDSGTIAPGSASHVALSLTMESGWHVYWQYAGDSGEAPTVSWSAPQGITLGPMQYPAPSRLPLGPLMDYGYEGTAIFPYALTAAQQLPIGDTTLLAHVQWLVCREVCLPGKALLGVALTVAPTASSVTNPLIDAAIHAEPSPLPGSVKVRASASRTLLTLDITTGKKESAAEYYPLDDASIRNAAEQKIEPTSHGVKLVTERADISDTLPKEVKGVLKLSGARSYNFEVPVTAPTVQANSGSEPGLLPAIALAFAGGIILNLMPCVFPVLFLKALALVNSANASAARQRRHGCFVLAVGLMMPTGDIPSLLPHQVERQWVERGGSAIIGPDLNYIVAPSYDREELIVADLDLSLIDREAMALDVTGHYARPDVFSFSHSPVGRR
jgi:DsbC/DsbD-like thiol-disulfide interchange protein